MNNIKIPFNKPYLTGKEVSYIQDAVSEGKISGNGKYTKLCQNFFEERFGFNKCLLTTSCSDALEMAAILLDIKHGDEVIIPSYTFVSTANAFMMRGAKIVFADSRVDHPGIDEDKIADLVTPKTKAIIPVHYAGVSCDMDKIMEIADHFGLFVVEDAAHSIDSYYQNSRGERKALGSIGHLSTFSFHETKNIISGEGGMLVVNDPAFKDRAEIIWEKGTNRAAFFRGEIDKYGWVDIGSSYLPSEIISAFLYAQLENLDTIQNRRKKLWQNYHDQLSEWCIENLIGQPLIPDFATNNAHMYYLVCNDLNQRQGIIEKLKSRQILSVFHYQSLHKSPFFKMKYDGSELPNSKRYSDSLLRLPLYFELLDKQDEVIKGITARI